MGMDARAGSDLTWVEPKAGTDLVKLKGAIEAGGGKVLTLAPEGRLLVRYPAGAQLASVPGVASAQPMAAAAIEAQPAGRGLGARKPTPESEAKLGAKRVASVAPNTLSTDRAALQGEATLASSVDNSLSIYFPPIRSQGGQGSCVAWASAYYYNTFTQASDEGQTASSGNNDVICSPAFVYNLTNGGYDNGLIMTDGLYLIGLSGSCTWTMMPYNQTDYLTWPTEAAWVDALKRRTSDVNEIGDWYDGCTDADILAIKQHLANGNIAITGTDIFDNMYYSYPSNTVGVNNGVLFANSATYVGGHAMTVVGYDDNKSYFDGTTTKYGAFLIANSWGNDWGTYNSAGTSLGFMWVAYDYFKLGHNGSYEVFGSAYFSNDRDNYRSKLYATAGVNHTNRGYLALNAGVGPVATPLWMSDYPLLFSGGTATSINDTKRVVVDMNDAIESIAWPNVNLFVETYLSSSATNYGSVSGATFYHDFDHNGTYEQVAATNTPLTLTPGNYSDATAQFVWCDGSLNKFAWSAIGSPQAYQPFTATITAQDALNRAVTGFTGTGTVRGCVDTTTTVGTGTYAYKLPLDTYWKAARTQSIYLHSELGGAATWTGLLLDVTTIPTQKLNNFTIRIKHTQQAYVWTPVWEDGWTTVCQQDRWINSTGWAYFKFDRPFVYNGTDNIIIDFSFWNTSYTDDALVNNTTTSDYRSLFKGSDTLGNPLTWTGWTGNPATAQSVPNIKLVNSRSISMTPGTTGNFTAGVWSGSVTVNESVNSMYLEIDDGAGHVGRSNLFNVAPGSPTGSLTVTINPPAAVSAGAMWRRVGQSTWRASGSTESGIAAGGYTVEFKQTPGWNTAASAPVTVTSGGSASASGTYTQMSVVWIDFGFGGTEYGTQTDPYCLLDHGINAVTSGGLIYLKPGTSSQTLRITKPLRLESVGGTATIGR
ncbi:C1 family peptidase [bacterium]|nr:C1 family peptidase [bacterium]